MKKWIPWLPSLLWMAVIFYLSSRTGEDLGGWLDEIRKMIPAMQGFDWGHFVAYFILALTFLWGLRPNRLNFLFKFIVVLMCVLYGFTDEFHQSFVPGRTPDLLDIRNDAIGSAIAMIAISLPMGKRLYKRLFGAKYY